MAIDREHTMGTKREIESVAWLLNEFSKKQTHPHTRYFYRGESEQGHALKPRLLRNKETINFYSQLYSCTSDCIVELQYALLERFRRYASSQSIGNSFQPSDGESPTLDEWLCIAQHHGLPTLLLDWSLHPLIGLYFSVRDEKLHDKAGQFWYLKLKNRKDRKNSTVRFRDKSGIKNGILLKNEEKDSDGLFKNKIVEPRIIVPWVFNKRIESQHARFTYSGKEHIDVGLEEIEDEKIPWDKLDWFEVPVKNKFQIKKDLEKLQIHEKTLFPDLDGLARYIEGGGI